MADAVIVSTARTPIGRAYRGAFNNTHGAVLGGHVIQHAVQRAGVEPGEVEDALASQQRTAAGQREGRFDKEIVPLATTKLVTDKASGQTREEPVTLEQDEGNRADTTAEGLAALKPVTGEKGHITAGNASQLSDGASACVVMDAALAAKRGLKSLGVFRGLSVAACEPDEMGIGPVVAVPRLLQRFGLK